MEACLLKLERHDYLIPDFLWFKIKALQKNKHVLHSIRDLHKKSKWHGMWVLVNLRILWYFFWLCDAVHNIYLPSPLQDMFANTFIVMSLQQILCQALERLGYLWYESRTPRTREGLYQTSIEVRSTPSPAVEPVFTIFGKSLPCRCEAMDNALIPALIFIDKRLGYKIGDVNNYVKYLLLANNMS